nr:hypothetical protein [Tanacetum cinerariifolium]
MSTPTFAKTHNLIAFLEKPSKSDGFEQIVDFLNATQIKYALTVSPTIYTACIKQFCTTLKIKTVNDDVRLQALIDGKKIVITEASIRHDLKLNDAESTSCLPNALIFKELARMGYEKPSEKLTFCKAYFSPQWKFFIHTILQCLSAKTTSWNEFNSTMAFAIICLANNQKFNFSKYIFDNLKKNLEAGVPFYMFPMFIQVFVNYQIGDMSHRKGIYVNPSLTKKVFANMKRVGTGFSRVVTPLFGIIMERKETEVSPTELHTEEHVPTTSNDPLPSGEDSMQLKELMVLCTNLSNKLENRVEKLEENNMSLTKELKSFNTKVESLAFKETVVDKEKSSKHGRKITDIDADAKVITTVKIIVDEVSTAGGELNAANEEPVSAALTNITTTQPKSTTTASSKSQVKDKGKAKLVKEPEVLKSRKAQIAIDEEDNAEKQKLEEQQEAEELKRYLEIVPDDKYDVFVNVAPLSSKPPTILDYKIYKEGKKEHFQIIRANGNHQMYLAFSIMLKNFDREDIKVLWKIVKDIFKESQPKEVLDIFLWHTLKIKSSSFHDFYLYLRIFRVSASISSSSSLEFSAVS